MPRLKEGWWIRVKANWGTDTGEAVWSELWYSTEADMLEGVDRYKVHHKVVIIGFRGAKQLKKNDGAYG